jgi:hypothetical protein
LGNIIHECKGTNTVRIRGLIGRAVTFTGETLGVVTLVMPTQYIMALDITNNKTERNLKCKADATKAVRIWNGAPDPT